MLMTNCVLLLPLPSFSLAPFAVDSRISCRCHSICTDYERAATAKISASTTPSQAHVSPKRLDGKDSSVLESISYGAVAEGSRSK